METCLLIPGQLSIAVTRHSDPGNFFEKTASIWSKAYIPVGFTFYPDGGQIYHGYIDIHSIMGKTDIRQTFGGYDLILEVQGNKMRHCNWIRFIRSAQELQSANIIGTWIGNRAAYQTLKDIEIGEELVVFFEDKRRSDETVNQERKLKEHDSDDDDEEIDVCGLSESEDEDGEDSQQSSIKIQQSTSTGLSTNNLTSPRLFHPSKRMRFSREECDSGVGDLTSTPKVSMVISSSESEASMVISSPESEVQTAVSSPERYEDFKRAHDNIIRHSTPLPENGNSLKRKRGKTWLPCEFCGKTFDRPSLLKRHERTHTGEKPHVCDVCSKAFSTSSSLNTHRRIHFGEKPHQCNICGKRFTASSNLYYHKMTHTKEKPHKCSLCTKSFPTPGDLRSHMHIHNGTYPFQCEVCQKGFSKQSSLKHHMSSHTATDGRQAENADPQQVLSKRQSYDNSTHQCSSASTSGSSSAWNGINQTTLASNTSVSAHGYMDFPHLIQPNWFSKNSMLPSAMSSLSRQHLEF